MPHLLLFGLGYAGQYISRYLTASGWNVTATKRQADQSAIAFDDSEKVHDAIANATHILSSVPPTDGEDPVIARYGARLRQAPASWLGYLSATGVYGDTEGAYVDETALIGGGRRTMRIAADLAWQELRPDVRVFRLPGIYGPGRSPLERVQNGQARRIDLPKQVFSRVHVDDIVGGIMASIKQGPAGIYNLADDLPCSQNQVIAYACRLMGIPLPPLQSLTEAQLSQQAQAFYGENRRIANGKAKRLLGWEPLYRNYREGLRALYAGLNP